MPVAPAWLNFIQPSSPIDKIFAQPYILLSPELKQAMQSVVSSQIVPALQFALKS